MPAAHLLDTEKGAILSVLMLHSNTHVKDGFQLSLLFYFRVESVDLIMRPKGLPSTSNVY